MVKGTFMKFNLAKWGVIGAIAGVLSFIVTKIFNFFQIPVFVYEGEFFKVTASVVDINLREQVLSGAMFKDAGLKFIDFLKGTLNFDLMQVVATIVAVMLIAYVGRMLVGFIPQNNFVRRIRVFLAFLFGGIAFAIAVPILFGLPYTATFLAVGLYTAILGIVMQILVNFKPLRFVTE